MHKVLTLNNISAKGLEQLPRDEYEIASERLDRWLAPLYGQRACGGDPLAPAVREARPAGVRFDASSAGAVLDGAPVGFGAGSPDHFASVSNVTGATRPSAVRRNECQDKLRRPSSRRLTALNKQQNLRYAPYCLVWRIIPRGGGR